jgi:hypothetical protein
MLLRVRFGDIIYFGIHSCSTITYLNYGIEVVVLQLIFKFHTPR